MKGRSKRLIAMLVMVITLVIQSCTVFAEETSSLLSPTNVEWNSRHTSITYNNPNTEDVWLIAKLYKNGNYQTYISGHTRGGIIWDIDLYFARYIQEAGNYKVTLYVVSGDLSDGEAFSVCDTSQYYASTSEFNFTCPQKIAEPTNIKFYTNGLITWDAVEGAAGYDISLYDITDGVGYPDVNYLVTGTSYDISFNIEEGRKYAVSISTISGDLIQYTSGDESDLVEWISSGSDTSKPSQNDKKKKVTKPWTPTTEDEKERYSYLGHDEVKCVVGTEGGYKAEPVNMMQGRLFFDVVEAAAPDYNIARTYNITVDGSLVYETAVPAMFVLNIPETYLVENREYKMVCVTKNGETIVLDDLDTATETISFLTNKFYAFALVYKDTVTE